MKVKNMRSSKGSAVANQFILRDDACEYFQSYDTIIALRSAFGTKLDRDNWDYSVITNKYRNQFLGETKAETQKKIDSGEYELVDLN